MDTSDVQSVVKHNIQLNKDVKVLEEKISGLISVSEKIVSETILCQQIHESEMCVLENENKDLVNKIANLNARIAKNENDIERARIDNLELSSRYKMACDATAELKAAEAHLNEKIKTTNEELVLKKKEHQAEVFPLKDEVDKLQIAILKLKKLEFNRLKWELIK